MPENNNGQLEKIRIESYSDAKYNNKGEDSFTAMFNPTKYTLKYEVEESKKQPTGTSPHAPPFAKMKPQEIDLEFIIDGTGATGEKVDVSKKIEEFLKATYEFKGDKHRPRYLRIWWGRAFVFDCTLKSADMSYTLFKSDGTPLRAKITGKFTGFVNDTLRERKEDRQSPDITHLSTVQDGERLDMLSHKHYEDPNYYIAVASLNQVTNLRRVKTGTSLRFPPLEVK